MIAISEALRCFMDEYYQAVDDHDRARCGAFLIGYLEALQEVVDHTEELKKIGAQEYIDGIERLKGKEK